MIDQFSLECIEGKRKGQLYAFPGVGIYQIGRQRDCDLPIPDGTVSSNHCTLTADGENLWLKDNGSINGTLVGDLPVIETKLQDGDIITLGGHCRFRLSIQNGSKEAQGETAVCELCGKSFPANQREEGLNICPHCMEYEGDAVLRFLLADTPVRNREAAEDALNLPGFRRLRKLGEGSFGAVWLVEEAATGRRMALKTMLESALQQELERKKFNREMSIASQLHHPNIVEIYDVGSRDGRTYILQEYCAGGSLAAFRDRTYLRYAGKLPAELAVDITMQLLDALDYAHHVEIQTTNLFGAEETLHGVVHRDIHPGNIFFAETEEPLQVKLGDWGLSKAYELAGLSGISVGNVPTGTQDFASMQQHMNFRYCGPETDVWSAAAVLFFLLTGSPPRPRSLYEPRSFEEAFPKTIPLRKLRPDLSQSLAEALDYTLAEQPRLRVLSAAELKDRLRSAMN